MHCNEFSIMKKQLLRDQYAYLHRINVEDEINRM